MYKLNLDKMEYFIKFVRKYIHNNQVAQTHIHEALFRTS